MTKKKMGFAALAAILTLCGMPAASSQAYPSKPIRFLVGFQAGGGTDITARLIGKKLEEAWGQPVIIDNRPGAGGMIATEFVARSAPDGYTLLMGGANAMTVNPVVYSKLSYDPLKDFVPISNVIQVPLIVAVHPSVPANSVKELIALIKANPGKIDFSSATDMSRLAGEMLSQMTSSRITRIPYKGGASSAQAAVAGDVPLTIGDGGSMRSYLQSGVLRALAVTTATRTRALPDLPTVAEAGVPDYDIGTWFGLFAPAGTPGAIISKLNAEIVRIVSLPDIQDKFVSMIGGDPIAGTAAEFAERIRKDIARYRPIAKAGNIMPE